VQTCLRAQFFNFYLLLLLLTPFSQLQPLDKDCYLQRAISYHHEGDYSAALRDLCQCIHLDPGNHLAYFWRGCLLRECHPRRALRDLGVSLLLDDGVGNLATYLNRAMLYVQLKQYQQAITDLQCVLKLDESNAARKSAALTDASVVAHTQLGLIYLNNLQRPGNAVKAFTNALAVNARSARALLCRAECYLRLHAAQQICDATYLELARRDYILVVHMHPDVPDYHLLLGSVFVKLNLFDAATHELKVAAALNLRFLPSENTLADAHAFIGNFPFAIELLQERYDSQCAVRRVSNYDIAAAAQTAQAKKLSPILFQLGTTLMQDRQFARAIRVFERALTMSQTNPTLFLQLGIALYSVQQFVAANDALTCAIKLSPRLALAFHYRALCRLAMREDRGIQDINTALALDPTLWQSFLARASFFSLLGRLPKAVLNCNEALRLQPSCSRAYVLRGTLKMAMRHFPDALEDFKLALEVFRGCSLALYNRGLCHLYTHNNVAAVRDLSTALLVGDSAPHHTLHLARALAYYRLGDYTNALLDLEVVSQSAAYTNDARVLHTTAVCLHRMGRLEDAVRAYDASLAKNPRFVEALLGRGNAHMDFLDEEHSKKSRRDYIRAIHLMPTCIDAFYNLALSLQAAGNLQQAWTVLTSALKVAPKSAILLEARGVINLQRSSFAAALLDLSSAIDIDPCADFLTNRGVVHQYMHNHVLALADFKAAAAADPRSALAQYNVATVYLHHGQVQQALDHFNTACALASDDECMFINRSVARCMMRDYRGALEDANRAAELSPASVHVLFNRACIHAALDDPAAALKDVSAFLTAVPGDVRAYTLRAKLHDKLQQRDAALLDHARAATIQYQAF
jgi:tetratricopeptide (TPR) repeat protein